LSINNRGQVVGFAYTASVNEHAFLFEHGVMTDLGILSNVVDFSLARGINDRGQVVGISYTASEAEHAVIWTPDHCESNHDEGGH
jgi:probable HAF family extracellular repeat protein